MKINSIVGRFSLVIMLAVLSCSQRPDVDPTVGEPLFPNDPTIQKWLEVKGVAQKALADKGQTEQDISQPRGYENASHTLIGRMPCVDEAMEMPLFMPEYALVHENAVSGLADDYAKNMFVALHLAGPAVAFYGMASKIDEIDLADDNSSDDGANEDLDGALKKLYALRNAAPEQKRVDFLKLCVGDEPIQDVLASLISDVADACAEVDGAFSKLTPDELDRISKVLPMYFRDPRMEPQDLRAFTVDDISDIMSIQDALGRVDFSKLLFAQVKVLLAVGRFEDAMKDAPVKKALGHCDLDTPFGHLVVGLAQNDVYTEDAFIIVDFGGNDRYLNNAGSSRPGKIPVSIVIDLAGDDVYESVADCVQACGLCGVGAILDVAGNDIYSAGSNSQAVGLCGAGAIVDCAGNDSYSGDLVVQGGGIYGTGLIIEKAGDDSYRCNSFGQGFGSTLGIGVLEDYAGNDSYYAGGKYVYNGNSKIGGAQGFATGTRVWPFEKAPSVYGGVGVLNDFKGDDRYVTDAYGQGASYFYGLGVFVDSEGNDRFEAFDFAHGSGTHHSAGVMVDKGGNDVYISNIHSHGAALDRAAGVLFDAGGNDSYETNDGQGYTGKPRSFSLFADYSGDDRHMTKNDGIGYSRPPYEEGLQCWSMFMDLGGNDIYNNEGKFKACVNDSTWDFGDYSFARDWYYNSPLASDMEPAPAPFVTPYNINNCKTPAMALFAFIAYNRLDEMRKMGVDELTGALKGLMQDNFIYSERVFVDHLVLLASAGKPMGWDMVEPVKGKMLTASAETKLNMLSLIRVRRCQFDFASLEPFVRDGSDEVRGLAAIVLSTRKDRPALDAVLNVVSDRSWVARRRCAIALKQFAFPEAASAAAKLIADPDFRVRVQAAYSVGALASEGWAELLVKALGDQEAYVRQAAARALVNKGDKRGMPALIDELDWNNWVVVSEEVTPFLKRYTGRDFGTDEAKWKGWWESVKGRYEVAAYSDLARRFDGARSMEQAGDSAAALTLFAEIKLADPGYAVIDKDYARVLNAASWAIVDNKATRSAELPDSVEMALRAVALDPVSAYYDTLAEAYFASGESAKAVEAGQKAFELAPAGEKEFYVKQVERFRGTGESKK